LYLIYLGARALWRKETIHFTAVTSNMPRGQLFRTGLLTSVLNPKSTLFFLAFLPQFVIPEAGQVPLQMFTLGAIWTLLCVFAYSVIAFSTGTFGNKLATTPQFGSLMRWVSGSVFVALGIRLLIPDRI
jgi:threonine/homoserine/homoserine lactone efflux protein